MASASMRWLIGLLAVFACVASAEVERPNILLIMAEDLSPRIGAFGDTVAVTPNLDSLAEQGVRYTNAFTTAGVCSPSRAAIILGMHQIATGTQHMRSSNYAGGGYAAVPPEQAKAWPELLRAAGYYTFNVGKDDYQFSGLMPGSGPFTIWDQDGFRIPWQDLSAERPFFGYVNIGVTHETGLLPALGEWPNSTTNFVFQLIRWATFEGELNEQTAVKPRQIQVPPYFPDTPTVREDMTRHYHNIQRMDDYVGTVLRQLDERGLSDNTIVIWTTDHGDALPRAKRELYDTGLQVPMIVRWPARWQPKDAQPGGRDKRLVSLVDLGPTVLQLAGIAPPGWMHGVDFTRSSRQYIYAARDRLDESVTDRQRAVRDHRFKYIRSWYPQLPGGHPLAFRDNINMMRELRSLYEAGQLNAVQRLWFEPPGKERLYDLEQDPLELHDIAADSDYGAVLGRMRNAMDNWLAETGDLGAIPEAELVARIQPEGEQQRTPPPRMTQEDSRLVISAQHNASIGYRIGDGAWQLYSGPIALSVGMTVAAKAVRYGWKESEVVDWRQ